MTDETRQDRSPPRRKFDDVASLFGTIVPPPSAVPRPVATDPAPAIAPPPPEQVPEPAPEPAPDLPSLAPEPPPSRPSPARKPRPVEVMWPDAFEPRPNFRRREPKNWSWLLLIPIGFVAAVGITTLDPRAIKSWLDANVLHRKLIAASLDAPPMTAPPQIPVPIPMPVPAPASPPVSAPAPIPEGITPYPALPTSPVPPPPGVEVSPPPVSPAETAAATAAAAPPRITIQFRRNIPGSDGEARRIANLLQSFGGSIELHPNNATTKVPTINYYNPSDKAVATALAAALANEAVSWVVRAASTKYPPGTLDVWLP